MKRYLAVLALAFLFQLTVPAQISEVDWSFPRANMGTRNIEGGTYYDLGGNFFGRRVVMNEIPTTIVILPVNLDSLIDKVNRSQTASVSDRDYLIVAACVDHAVIASPAKPVQYLGPGKLMDRRFHFFRTSNGAYLAGAVVDTRKFVVLLDAPNPGPTIQQ